ncbi:hypothetical protein DL93DRAFT_2075777, partial [Clavulina sp. PMI_390]
MGRFPHANDFNTIPPYRVQHATHAEIEKELGFSLLSDDVQASSPRIPASTLDDLPDTAELRATRWDASEFVHLVDEIYQPPSRDESDDSSSYNDI